MRKKTRDALLHSGARFAGSMGGVAVGYMARDGYSLGSLVAVGLVAFSVMFTLEYMRESS